MDVLAILEQTRVPIQIQALKVLYDLLKPDPESGRVRSILGWDTISVIGLEAAPGATT
jgi:hypothetical protein